MNPLQGWERPGINVRLVAAIGQLVPAQDRRAPWSSRRSS